MFFRGLRKTASGKSTFAKEYIKNNPHTIIVCRDSIRSSFGEYWVPEREDLVSRVERENIISGIEMGWDVVIDATNLNPKTIAKWEALADQYKCDIEYKTFWIPFNEAIQRDKNPDRDHSVGYKVLYNFYKKYNPDLLNDKNWDFRYIKPRTRTKPKAIIVDVDGTVALRRGRSPYDYEKCDQDEPEERVLQIVNDLGINGYTVIFVSGREKIGNCEEKTRKWLTDNYGENFMLYMRSYGDHRPDKIVKEELYHTYIEPIYDVVAVFDDRNQCIDLWRSLGLLALQSYYGDF